MHPVIEEIYASRQVLGPDGKPREAFPASLGYDDGMALYRVIRDTNAKRALEVGMAYGISSLFILQGLDENGGGALVSIDPWQEKWWEFIGVAMVERANFADRHTLHAGRSLAVMPELVKQEARFDFIFIDGNHRFEYSLADFLYADMLLEPGGHVVLHDPWLPAIRKTVSFIATNRADGYELVSQYCQPPRSALGGVWEFLRAVRRNPYDLKVARYFSRKSFANYVVFRKTRHIEPEAYDAAWDFYRPF